MNIFSNLNLHGNGVEDLTASKLVLSNTGKDVVGSIRYNGGLQYFNGEGWVTVGTTSPTINNVSGAFNIVPDSSTGGNGSGDTVPVHAEYAGASSGTQLLVGFNSSKHELYFDNQLSSTQHKTAKVDLSALTFNPGTIIQKGTFTINAQTSGTMPFVVTVTHTLGTSDVQASVYIKDSNTTTTYHKILCDVDIISNTVVKFTITNGDPSNESDVYGTYKFILIGSSNAKSVTSANVSGEQV